MRKVQKILDSNINKILTSKTAILSNEKCVVFEVEWENVTGYLGYCGYDYCKKPYPFSPSTLNHVEAFFYVETSCDNKTYKKITHDIPLYTVSGKDCFQVDSSLSRYIRLILDNKGLQRGKFKACIVRTRSI